MDDGSVAGAVTWALVLLITRAATWAADKWFPRKETKDG